VRLVGSEQFAQSKPLRCESSRVLRRQNPRRCIVFVAGVND
jgi:hypothetical protein